MRGKHEAADLSPDHPLIKFRAALHELGRFMGPITIYDRHGHPVLSSADVDKQGNIVRGSYERALLGHRMD